MVKDCSGVIEAHCYTPYTLRMRCTTEVFSQVCGEKAPVSLSKEPRVSCLLNTLVEWAALRSEAAFHSSCSEVL